MKKNTLLGMVAYAAFLLAPAMTAPVLADDDREWPTAWFEIFKMAPGRHEAFMREIAKGDEVSKAGGQPPIQLFIHQNGADWDVLMFKPVTGIKPTPEQEAAMEAKSKELNMPSGPAYFVNFRKNIIAHTDTETLGPVSAEEWLARRDKWREEHPDAEQ